MNKIYTSSELFWHDLEIHKKHPDRNIVGQIRKIHDDGRFLVLRKIDTDRYQSMLITSDYKKAKDELSMVIFGRMGAI